MIIKKTLHESFDLSFSILFFLFRKEKNWIRLLQIAILIASFAAASQAQKFNVIDYYESNSTKKSDEFFGDFPYDEYLKQTGIEDIQQLEKDRYYLWDKFKDGDPFLYNLEDYYVINNPIKNIQGAENRIVLAEKYLDKNRKFDPIGKRITPNHENINQIYIVVGHFLMATSARWIGEQVKQNNIDVTSPEIKTLVERMKDKKVLIELPETDLQKLTNRTSEQAAARAFGFIEKYRKNILTVNVTITIVTLLLLIFFTKIRVWMFLIFIPSLGFLVFLVLNPPESLEIPKDDSIANSNRVNANTDKKPLKTLPTHCLIEDHSQFTSYQTETNSDVNFYSLKEDKEGDKKEIGQLIKMNGKNIKVAYYIKHTSIPIDQWLAQLREKAKIVLITSGGYSNSLDQPEGLTFENGNLINAVLLHDRKALVKINKNRVSVLNLKNLKLPTLNKNSGKADDSFVSLSVYAALVKSLQDEQMTSFQTHLLAYEGDLKIDPEKSDKDLAERRFLAIVKSKIGEEFNILINVKSQQNLGIISTNIFNLLSNQEYEITALLNLDTGKYNILEVFNDLGEIYKVNNEKVITGTKDMKTATNLLVFYIDK